MDQQNMVKLMKKKECLKKYTVKYINKLVKKANLLVEKKDIMSLKKYVAIRIIN